MDESHDKLGEWWYTFTVRCAFSNEEWHPEETDLVIDDVESGILPGSHLMRNGWIRDENEGALCPYCVERLLKNASK